MTAQYLAARTRGRRTLLLATSACLFLATGAHAQDGGLMAPLELVEPSPQAQPTAFLPESEPEPQIVVGQPNTPTTIIDTQNITGVGQMIIDQQNGFISTCTGTLINPRTVLFAAHCVNTAAANSYGSAQGGRPIGFGFGANNNVAGASAFGNWLNGYRTNISQAMYNANYVAYNPVSTEAASGSFRYSDVAVASLDTPAKGIPTWTLLFSALPNPGTATAAGTGYHVVIEGYGRNGTGTTGSTGSDYRRRVAENTLGALTSLDTFSSFIFNSPNGLYQNLYFIDFDDPRRGTASASPYDFNAFRDNPLPKEGITASGDSGGPLILDKTFNKPVVIGVLSGGYTRFFTAQADNAYGTVAFYQPLYLYWDWIAANNPFHYVSAKAGNGDWNDASHWVTDLDPAYMVIDANGNLVNGLPTALGEGKNGTAGAFGQICFESGGVSECYDTATGNYTLANRPIGTDDTAPGDLSNAIGTASVDSLIGGSGSETATADGASPNAAVQAAALPAPTLTNGLPGATNFVPNNSDGNRLTSTPPRYFDVQLSAAGTTTLSSTVVIDRFAIVNGGAALDIRAGGSLTSLMDITQYSGMMRVNGALRSQGDYLLLSGGLQGSGTITVPYLTSVAGVIAPGTVGTTGTLTVQGNVVLSSGTVFLVDIGESNVSDRLSVLASVPDLQGAPIQGNANIGGTVVLTPTAGTLVRYGNTYTILSTQGNVTGTFNALAPLSAILRPEFVYGPKSVSVRINAGTYASIVGQTAIERSYAKLLDQNRSLYGNYSDLYGPLDMMSVASIRASFDSLAPRNKALAGSMSVVALETLSGLAGNRALAYEPGNIGGSDLALAPGNANPMGTLATMSSASALTSPGTGLQMQDRNLSDTAALFFAGGYIDGDSASMPGTIGGGRDAFDGWFAMAGVEVEANETSMVGFSLGYAKIDGTTMGAPQTARSELFQGTLYSATRIGNFNVDALFGAGLLQSTTTRGVAIGASPYTLRAEDDALALTAQVGVGQKIGLGNFSVMPRASIRYDYIGFTPTAETGGAAALQYDLGRFDSLQGRLGATVSGGGAFRPFVTANYVHDFDERPAVFGANLVGGRGSLVGFALNGTDQNWGEVSGGISYRAGSVEFSVSANTSFERSDIDSRSYQGSVTIRF